MSADDQYGIPIAEPRPISFETSYSHSLQAQRFAGVRQEVHRAPQSLPTPEERVKSQKAAASASAAANAPPKPVNASGKALVKSVLSGDSIVLVGNSPAGEIAQEKVVRLSGITAPRLGRGKKIEDEPYAFEAREFLRHLIVGKVVSFQVNHVHESNNNSTEYAVVKLEDEQNVGDLLVSQGLAKANPGNPKKDGSLHPERQALVNLENAAKENKLGMWAAEGNPNELVKHTRIVDTEPDSKALFAEFKNKPLPAIVEYVRDGSTYRLELTGIKGGHKIVTLFLSGVQCPRLPPPNSGQAVDPLAALAKDFVEMRLLQRDVTVVLQGVDKSGNLFGTIDFQKRNISVQLLKNGLATLVPWSAALTANAGELQAAEEIAKAQRLNYWAKHDPVAEEKSRAAAAQAAARAGINENNFAATVTNIFSGDSVTVVDSAGREKRVYLASIQAPRMGNLRKNVPDADYAYEAREFLRKKLIGKKVQVVVQYTRAPPKESNDKMPRVHVNLIVGNASISQALVAAGLADVIQHRIEDPRASDYDTLIDAEEKAKAAKRGRHSGQPSKTPVYTDLTDRVRGDFKADDTSEKAIKQRTVIAKTRTLLSTLQKEKPLRGVVEHVFSATRLKVIIPKHDVIIPVVLSSVRDTTGILRLKKNAKPAAAPQAAAPVDDANGDADENGDVAETAQAAPEAPAQSLEELQQFADEAFKHVVSQTLLQDITLDIEGLDKADNYVAQVNAHGKNLAVELLERGLLTIIPPSADRSPLGDVLRAAESRAKAAKLKYWKNWVPPPPRVRAEAKPAPEEAEAKEVPQDQRQQRIRISNIVDGCRFFAHQVGNKNIAVVEDKMKNFQPGAAPANFEVKRGMVVAGLFADDNLWYRVRIEGKNPEGTFRASFIDFGNVDNLPLANLRPLADASLAKIAPLAKECTLSGLKAPARTSDWFEQASLTLNDLAYGRDLDCKVDYIDFNGLHHVTLNDPETQTNINLALVKEGLARVLRRPERRLKDALGEIRAAQEDAKLARRGVWEYGDVSDGEDEDPREKARGP